MADPSYLDYEADPALNGVGQSSQTRFPEGWPGKFVNDALRWMGAALRGLGNSVLFAPDAEGTPSGRTAGSMALQNADAVTITGGSVNAYGYVPVGTILPVLMSWANFLAVYETYFRPYGWIFCDGRTETNPFTGAAYVAPNLLGRYLVGFDNASVVGTGAGFFGSTSKTTELAGTHNHGGVTGETALTVNQIPPHSHPYTRTTGSAGTSGGGGLGNGATASTGDTGGGQGHLHSIAPDGSHQHAISDIRPLSVMVIPVIRAW